MHRYLTTVLSTFILAGLPSAVLAAPEGIERAAREVLVSIDGCNSGSGVIIEQQGTTYSVLTLKNLVANAQATCWLITPDGSRIKIAPENLKVASGQANLAMIQFKSDKTYSVANLGTSQKPQAGDAVYIAAFQRSLDSGFSPTLQIEESQVLAGEKSQNSRHSLLYDDTATALFDFQGAPVFNREGEVMGIHGQEESGSSSSGRYNLLLQKSANSDSGASESKVESPIAPWFGMSSTIQSNRRSPDLDRPSLPIAIKSDASESSESSSGDRDSVAGAGDSNSSEVQSAPLSSTMLTDEQKQIAVELHEAQREEKKGFPMALVLSLAGTGAVVATVYSL